MAHKSPPRAASRIQFAQYLATHKIHALLDHLVSQLAEVQPQDPLALMYEEIRELMGAEAADAISSTVSEGSTLRARGGICKLYLSGRFLDGTGEVHPIRLHMAGSADTFSEARAGAWVEEVAARVREVLLPTQGASQEQKTSGGDGSSAVSEEQGAQGGAQGGLVGKPDAAQRQMREEPLGVDGKGGAEETGEGGWGGDEAGTGGCKKVESRPSARKGEAGGEGGGEGGGAGAAGKLTVEEVKAALEEGEEEVSEEAVRAVFAAVDEDGGGKVTLAEFKAGMRGRRALERELGRGGSGIRRDVEQLSRKPKGVLMRWLLMAWNGAELRAEFSKMGSNQSNTIDVMELRAYLEREQQDFGEWKDDEVEDFFRFLDADNDGKISLGDFNSTTVGPQQHQQLQQAIQSEELGLIIASAMPIVTGWDEHGKLRNALADVLELEVEDLEKIVKDSAHQIAKRAFDNLAPFRDAGEQAEESPTGAAKFTYTVENTNKVEMGDFDLGLPSHDIAKAMEDEHKDGTKWTTKNYKLKTTPKQEWEFVDCPVLGKTYPGEDTECRSRSDRPRQGLRRRQDASEVWREMHEVLPVEEALESFKSFVGQEFDSAALVGKVKALLKGHATPEDKKARFKAELEQTVLTVLPEVVGKAQNDRYEGEDEFARRKAEEKTKQTHKLVMELRRLVDGWDLSLEEIKAVVLYTGPMFEKYNGVLRTQPVHPPYKNTLLMLISAVMKLRKRTILGGDRLVHRGLSGGELPMDWILEGFLGSKGGAEKAFMSTSKNRAEAAKYAARGVNPTLLQMALGQVDKGADISQLSQYPGEAEVLFPPMSNIEVEGMPRLEMHGNRSIMVLSVRVNVSLKNLTREELEAKRKTVFMPSLYNILQELEHEVAELLKQPPKTNELAQFQAYVQKTVMSDCRDVVAKYEAQEPEWFLHDQHYQLAVQQAAGLKRVAVAKVQRFLDAEVTWEEGKHDEALREWMGQWRRKLLSVVNVEVLNERKRRWEVLGQDATTEDRQESALALCEWQGLVDRDQVDMTVDVAGHTSLHLAAMAGDNTTLKLLLDSGCNPELKNKSGQNVLSLAASESQARAISVLLEVATDFDAVDQHVRKLKGERNDHACLGDTQLSAWFCSAERQTAV